MLSKQLQMSQISSYYSILIILAVTEVCAIISKYS